MSGNAETDDRSLEGPDVELPTEPAAQGDPGDNDGEGTMKPGGLGGDGTIPANPNGIAAGHTGVASTFEPEEDEKA